MSGLSLNDLSQNDNKQNSVLANRLIPASRKINREPNDYEKNFTQRGQQTAGIIESM